MDEEGERESATPSAHATFNALSVGCAALVLLGGIPIMWLGMAYFGGGVGSALNGFRMGLAEPVLLNWAYLLPLALLPIYLWLAFRRGGRPSLPAALVVGAGALFGLFLLLGSVEDEPIAERPSACHRGVYTLDDGRLMAVSLSPVAALNFDLSDGSRIMTWGSGDQSDYSGTACIGSGTEGGGGFAMVASSCPATELSVQTHDAPEQVARRVPYSETDASFEADGLSFRARLFRPIGNLDAPLVILPARRDGGSRLDWGYTHYMLIGLGFSVLAYDKPDEWPFGRSAIDSDESAISYASAALTQARSLAGTRVRVGYFGDRDALLGALHTDADFAVVDGASLPDALLSRVSAPVLWLLPSNHAGVPERSLVRRLNTSGKDITLVTLPPVDEHGAWYRVRDGEKCHINEPPHFWQTVQVWLRDRTNPT